MARETDPFELCPDTLGDYNSWMATNIQEVFRSKDTSSSKKGTDQNEQFLTMFRLLTIKHRADNPITGEKKNKVSVKLERVLSHTVVGSLEEFFMGMNK